MARKVTGKCHLCGSKGKLSFEHVPPRKAFNDRPVLYSEFEKIVEQGVDDEFKGKINQRGAGDYTLCPRCNNNTGSWYGTAFVEWACQGMHFLHATKRDPILYLNFFLFPLRVIKQILCMFCSANGHFFAEGNPELRDFILDRERKYLPSDWRLYCFYHLSMKMRTTGIVARGNLSRSAQKRFDVFSEITFPPFGYVLSKEKSPPDERLQDITFFANFTYDEWRDVSLKLPVLPVYTFIPGDYRSEGELREQVKKNRKIEQSAATDA